MKPVDWICAAMLVPTFLGALGLLVGIAWHFAREALDAFPRDLGVRWNRVTRAWRKSAAANRGLPAIRHSLPTV